MTKYYAALTAAVFLAFLGATFSVARADSAGTAAALNKLADSGVGRACKGAAADGPGATAKNLRQTIRCYSIANHIFACDALANETRSLLDMERSGRDSFRQLREAADNTSGPNALTMSDGVTLAEGAPKQVSPDTFALSVYRQCASAQ